MRVLLIIIPIALLSLLFTNSLGFVNVINEYPPSSPTTTYSIVEDSTQSAEQALQLRTIRLTPRSSCDPSRAVAVDLLLDTSSSMRFGSKMPSLIEAVISFSGNLQPDDVIGVQEFSSPGSLSCGAGACDVIPISTFSSISGFDGAIRGLTYHSFTHMRDGFLLASQRIAEARPSYPDHTWILIFLSDGIPESSVVAPDEGQNPTDIAQQIKDSGVRIITIGLELDTLYPPYIPYARNLLSTLASTASDFHESPSASDLASIYQSISQSICR